MKNYLIRELRSDEVSVLEDFLYEAIFQPDKDHPLPREVVKRPEIGAYIDHWGEKDDLCLVAVVDDRIIGAVWTRILAGKIRGYGNIDQETPEFAISLYKEYRHRGIGRALMNEMISLLKKKGYRQASLSVAKDNYAIELYKDVGFKVLRELEEDYLMVIKLDQ
jgi:ribosomal protein S18 acetylase RimI-like enzyme